MGTAFCHHKTCHDRRSPQIGDVDVLGYQLQNSPCHGGHVANSYHCPGGAAQDSDTPNGRLATEIGLNQWRIAVVGRVPPDY